ncbi:MAG: hypothetical protein JO269_05275 [Burkholderiaceae bacterium]|nr:hypothetical protein [Burkholderiaceae bacterium]
MDTTLYDHRGNPVAYFEDEGGRLIYLWSGHAVAYLKGELVYGWNGQHIGWYVESVLYDTHGLRVGSLGDKCPFMLKDARNKADKRTKGPLYERRTEFKRPNFRRDYSERGLEEFLRASAGALFEDLEDTAGTE